MNQITDFFGKGFAVVRLDLKNLLEFRFQLYAQLFVLPVKILVIFLVWQQILSVQSNRAAVSVRWLLLYYIVLGIVEFITTPYCAIAYELMQDVRQGTLDIYLTRPFHYLVYRFLSHANYFIIFFSSMILFLLSKGESPLSVRFWGVLYFCAVSVLILYILFAFVGICSFWAENVLTFRDNVWNVIRLLAGSIIPVDFYPPILRKAVEFLPFQFIYYKPVFYCLGDSASMGKDVLLSFVWAGFLGFILAAVWRRAVKHYSSQGG